MQARTRCSNKICAKSRIYYSTFCIDFGVLQTDATERLTSFSAFAQSSCSRSSIIVCFTIEFYSSSCRSFGLVELILTITPQHTHTPVHQIYYIATVRRKTQFWTICGIWCRLNASPTHSLTHSLTQLSHASTLGHTCHHIKSHPI